MNIYEKTHQREEETQPEDALLAIRSMKRFIGRADITHTDQQKDKAREQILAKTSYVLEDNIARDLIVAKIHGELDTYHYAREIVPEKDPPLRIPGSLELEGQIAQHNLSNLKRLIIHYLTNKEKYFDSGDDVIQYFQDELDRIKDIESTGIMELEPENIRGETDIFGNFRTVMEQDGGSFFHVFGIGQAFGSVNNIDRIDCRLYMCPKAENVVDLCKAIFNALYQRRGAFGRFYLKFAIKGNRNDRIVYYTNFDKIPEDLEILNEIAKGQPELFEGMGKNPFWGNIEGAPKGVYFGEEIQEPLRRTESYGSLRAKIFDQTYEQWRRLSPKTELFRSFYKLYGDNLYKNGINPNNLCVNL